MLWSFIKILIFIAAIAGLTFAGGYLAETGGGVRIVIANTEFNLGPVQAVVALMLLIVTVWLLLKVLSLLGAVFRFLNGDETAISRYFDRNRERRGFEALSEGLTALASGEGRLAMSKAAKAEKYLGRPELTNLISAQAAEMSGDRSKAAEVYKRLLSDDRTRFVGVRGLMKQKLEDGQTDVALSLASHAFALKPRHVETGDILLRLQAEQQDWGGARKTLAEKQRQGSIPRDVHQRRDAVLALSEARDVFQDDNSIESREAAIEANRLSPDLIPAAVMAAHAYIADGKPRYATRVLKKAWAAQPHPDLAAAFASVLPQEDPQARIKRFKGLIKSNPDHPEARMLMGELNVAARNFSDARKAIGSLVESDPSARSLAIMAAIERGEGSSDEIVRGWLAKAVTASRGPQWLCENCQTVHSNWGPVCSQCGGFDTMSWKVPAEGEVAMPASTEMLPLIVDAQRKEEENPDAEFVEEVPEDVIVTPHPDDPGTEK